MEQTEKNLAYAAGFFDGEGSAIICCVSSGRYKGKMNPQIIFSNTHKGVLEWIKDVLGVGSVSIQDSSPRRNWKHKVGYRLVYAGQETCYQVAKLIRPHLIVKKPQVDLVVEFIESRKQRNARVYNARYNKRECEIALEIKKLNRRGVRRKRQGDS